MPFDPGAEPDEPGRVATARWVPSPNFDMRPAGERISLLVIHNISLPPGVFGGDGVERLFTNRLDHGAHPFYATLKGVEVSAHFLIRRDGELLQFVSCLDRAWHAGLSEWHGRQRCNDFSIGVELEGVDDRQYEESQYIRLADLTRMLCARYPIADIAGHSDISPGRKSDPGPAFDWMRFRAATAGLTGVATVR